MTDRRIVALVSGKGGVGRTWLAVALAQAAAADGKRVLVLDGDLALANIDIQIGMAPVRDLSTWALGQSPLQAIVQKTDAGFDLIPGASGAEATMTLPAAGAAQLAAEFAALVDGYDLGLIDTGGGLGQAQTLLAAAADRCLLVVTEEPTSLADGFAFVKYARRQAEPPPFDVAVNKAESKAGGVRAHSTFARACRAFLDFDPALVGVVRRDAAVAAAIRRQLPLLQSAPESRAAADVRALLAGVLDRPAEAT